MAEIDLKFMKGNRKTVKSSGFTWKKKSGSTSKKKTTKSK